MMEKKNLTLISLTLCLSLFAGVAFGYTLNPLIAHKNPSIVANVEISENVGGVTAVLNIPNVITDIGENWTGEWLGSCGSGNTTARNATIWISLSNDSSPVDTWTELAGESTTNNFTRAQGTVATWMNSGDYAYNVTYTFTATGTEQLQCAGLQWSGVSESNNNLFACASFALTTFNAADTLTVKWSITVNAND